MLVSLSKENAYDIDWDLAKSVIDKRTGIPVEIGTLKSQPPLMTSVDTLGSTDTQDESLTSSLQLKLDTDIIPQ